VDVIDVHALSLVDNDSGPLTLASGT